MPLFFLVDNGSLRPESTFSLRRSAKLLQEKIGAEVVPISLLHSDRVAPEELEGQPAEILEPALRERLSQGLRDFVLVPFFFGPSRALTDYIPGRVKELKKNCPDMIFRMAPPLG
ncbi:MAG: CbiX/SirB N-terminal domain-containing protein, partial [Opitutales bacterium]